MPALFDRIPHNLTTFRLFIFDLDGTLYNQLKLRRKILLHLLLKLIFFQIRPVDLIIIKVFRETRERHKGFSSQNLDEEQYQWCAELVKFPASYVRQIISKYMFSFPLKHMSKLRYPGVSELFLKLNGANKSVVVFSDYPANEKMLALGLKADRYFCSTDPEISQLKPSAKALQHICTEMNCNISETLLIGDRDDTDGESARLAGMAYLIIDPHGASKGNFFLNLGKKIE